MSPPVSIERLCYATFPEDIKSVDKEYVDFMEFTGKLGKFGVKIFEKDVIELMEPNQFGSFTPRRGVVGWCEHYLNWAVYPTPDVEGSEHFFLGSIPDMEVHVIVNTWENPELLKLMSNAKS